MKNKKEKFVVVKEKDFIVSHLCKINNILYTTPYIENLYIKNKINKILTFFNIDDKIYNKEILNFEFDAVIVFDFIPAYIKWLKKKFPDKRVIYFYWNPVTAHTKPSLINQNNCELWTYSQKDSIDYGLRKNTTFWSSFLIKRKSKKSIDIFFIGKEKGRKFLIDDFLDKTSSLKLNNNIHIVKDKKFSIVSNYRDRMPYFDVIEIASKSRALLDVYTDEYAGYSMRVMESLFLNIKLITNNKNIMNELFYKKNNIFIIGYDDENGLCDFLDSEYENVDEDIVRQYDFLSWISRFCHE